LNLQAQKKKNKTKNKTKQNKTNGIHQVCCPWMAKTKSSCLKNNNKKIKWAKGLVYPKQLNPTNDHMTCGERVYRPLQ
jgi:hypothetical protein